MGFLIALALGAAAWQQQPIDFPAGYYTVGEVAASLTHQGVATRAAPACGSDVYALRIDKVPFTAVRGALERDGRLTIEQRGDSWIIERSQHNTDSEVGTLKRYLAKVRASIYGVYAAAASDCREIAALPQDQRNDAADKVEEDERSKGRPFVSRLVYLCYGHELAYICLSIPAGVADPVAPMPLARAFLSNLFDARRQYFADGLLEGLQWPPAADKPKGDQLAEYSRSINVGAKVTFDPLSCASTMRVVLYRKLGNELLTGTAMPHVISPDNVTISMTPKDVWSEAEIAAQKLRAEETPKVETHSEAGPTQAAVPASVSQRTSAELLRCAETERANVVYYVSPLTDYVLRGAPRNDVHSVLNDVNGTGIDQAALVLAAKERVSCDVSLKSVSAVQPLARMTASAADGVIAVRNEMRFLDGLCASSSGMPTAVENAELAGRKPKIDALLKHLASLNLAAWDNSVFATNYLTICNPIAFRPFALALLKSPTLRKSIAALVPGAPVEFRFDELEGPAKVALVAGAVESSLLDDETPVGGPDPMLAGALIRDEDPTRCSLRVERGIDGEYKFAIQSGVQVQWTAWLRNVTID